MINKMDCSQMSCRCCKHRLESWRWDRLVYYWAFAAGDLRVCVCRLEVFFNEIIASTEYDKGIFHSVCYASGDFGFL